MKLKKEIEKKISDEFRETLGVTERLFAFIGAFSTALVYPISWIKQILPFGVLLFIILLIGLFLTKKYSKNTKLLNFTRLASRYVFALLVSFLVAIGHNRLLEIQNKPKPFKVTLQNTTLDKFGFDENIITTAQADSLRSFKKFDTIRVFKNNQKRFITKCSDFNLDMGSIPASPLPSEIEKFISSKNTCVLLNLILRSSQYENNFVSDIFGNFEDLPIELFYTSGTSNGKLIDDLKSKGKTSIKFFSRIQSNNYRMSNNCVTWNLETESYKICKIFEADINNDGYCDVVLKVNHRFGTSNDQSKQSNSRIYTITKKSDNSKYETIE